jgi:hypothetical protein
MRQITFEGVEHKLSERNWKQLLRRFNPQKASLNAFGYYTVRGNSICVNREYKCIRCPLRDPHKRINSCTYLFRRIIGEDLFPYVHLYDFGVMWAPKYDEEVRQALQRVTDVLLGAEKVSN